MPDEIVMARASMRAKFLAADGDDEGTFRALVSAYGVKYRIGYFTWHTIEPGTFAESLADQDAIPIFWMHAWSFTEQAPIGHGAGAEEGDGLVIEGELYLDEGPEVRRVWRAMKAGAIREWSIGYQVLATRTDPDDEDHQFVTEGELLEASSVLRGANPETETLEVASRLSPDQRAQLLRDLGVDPDTVARLDQPAPEASPEPEPARLSLLRHQAVRQMYGDALAGSK